MYTPVNPSFIILKWGVRGSTLFGHVSMMINKAIFTLSPRNILPYLARTIFPVTLIEATFSNVA